MKKVTVTMQYTTYDELADEAVRNLADSMRTEVEETVRDGNKIPILWDVEPQVTAVPLLEGNVPGTVEIPRSPKRKR